MIHTRLREWHPDRHLCSLDPISLTGLALGALGGLGAGAASGAFGGSGGGAAATPSAPTPPPTPAQALQPAQQPTGSKPTPKSQAPTFLGALASPQPTQSGAKTLLGQ